MRNQLVIAALLAALATTSCGSKSDNDQPASWGNDSTAVEARVIGACDSMAQAPHDAPLQLAIERYVSKKDALIGVCVVTDSLVYGINADESFPMMSTVKFTTALAVADKDKALTDTIKVKRSQLRPGTWSPLQRLHRQGEPLISVDRLLKYALMLSDNNAFDILTEYVGGPAAVQDFLERRGINGISFKYYENEMNANWELYPDNSCTPRAMATLVYNFHRLDDTPATKRIKELMAACKTGADRLRKGITDEDAVLHHKTGTGGNNPRTRRLRSINDVGYVDLPSRRGGGGYAIAILVAEANFDAHEAARCIADLSQIVYTELR